MSVNAARRSACATVYTLMSVKLERFESLVMPHLNAAYNLARWLMRNQHDAEDAVQEAYLRALRFFDSFHGDDARPWLLAIVRNTCRTPRRAVEVNAATTFDEEKHAGEGAQVSQEDTMMRQSDIDSVKECIEVLPPEYREVVILRELEGLSYKDIAAAIASPIGTVMSRLARARARLLQCLSLRVRKAGV